MFSAISSASRHGSRHAGIVFNSSLFCAFFLTFKMFAQKGVELVQELERSKDLLPPFNVC